MSAYAAARTAPSIAAQIWRSTSPRRPGASSSAATPNSFTPPNPFEGLERVHPKVKQETIPATRDQAYALAKALKEMGHPHLGAAPLICFEWLQRPENVLAGLTTWPGYRPPSRPNHVQIEHHKTGKLIWHPLQDSEGRFYPEIEDYLAGLDKLGVSIVLTPGERGETGRTPTAMPAAWCERRGRKLGCRRMSR